jgi:hypothetical protein
MADKYVSEDRLHIRSRDRPMTSFLRLKIRNIIFLMATIAAHTKDLDDAE